MENLSNIAPAPDLQPPKESRGSIVLNSVGNGMMLGAIPFLGLEAHALIKKVELSPAARAWSLAASAVGGVLGWVFGEKEANRLENYRMNVARELTELRNEVEELKQDRRNWGQQIRDEAQEKEASASNQVVM
jgi:hypothetical protein